MLTEKKASKKLPVGSSKFFGSPDVWDDFRMPASSEEDGDGTMQFMCQINCAQAEPYDTEGLLPRTGMLYFFYGGHYSGDGAVLYYDGDPAKLKPLREGKHDLPEYKILFDRDADQGDVGSGGHSLLGEPSDPEQMGLGAGAPDDWQMLLELDSWFGDDDGIDFNFGGDCGMLCWFIDKKKLAEKDFSTVWCIEYGY